MKTEQIRGLIAQATDTLAAELEAGKSGQLQAYLAAIGRFHRHSVRNAILIWLQCPTATRVAGFWTWKRLGRRVRRGERGIQILAPIIRRPTAKDKQEDGDEEDVVAFRPAYVFDLSQTEGKPLPQFAAVNGEPGIHQERLGEFLRARGIAVEFAKLPGSVQGASMGGKIVVREDLPPAQRFSTTVHEAAHELLAHHGQAGALTKTVRETEAEAVAFVVSQAIGLDCGTAGSDYIKLYHGGKETLLASLGRIRAVAAEIIGALLDAGDTQAAASAETAEPAATAAA